MERKRVKSKPHECMAFREIASSFPARRVSSTFVSFQWGNGSHCQECQNKPTIPRRSYGTLCQIDSSDKQTRTTRERSSRAIFRLPTKKRTSNNLLFFTRLLRTLSGSVPSKRSSDPLWRGTWIVCGVIMDLIVSSVFAAEGVLNRITVQAVD
jgi:hypothetical protein